MPNRKKQDSKFNLGFLTKKKVGKLLKVLYPEDTFYTDSIYTDFVSEKLKLAVDFHNSEYYVNPRKIENFYEDQEKLVKDGYRFITIPYYCTMNEKMLKALFQDGKEIELKNRKVGFFQTGVCYPSVFCSLGLIKFTNELKLFSSFGLQDEILESLFTICHKGKMSPKEVFPEPKIFQYIYEETR